MRLIGMLLGAAGVLGIFAADEATFHATVSLVKLDAYVYDRDSRAPIVDLKASDFVILDEDQPRAIAYFAGDSGPVDIFFLLDVSGSVREVLPKVADSATEALAILEPGDRAAVMAFSKKTIVTAPFSADFSEVARGIRSAMSARIGLDTDINQALWSAATYLHDSGGTARRAILILTDNMQETRVPDSLVNEQLADAGAVLDGFLLRGPVTLPHVTHPGILGFARNSGGEIIEGNRPDARLAEMIRRIKFRYSIHFPPAEAASAKPRRIHIELTDEAKQRYPNATIRARRIYFPGGAFRRRIEVPARQEIAEIGVDGPGLGVWRGVPGPGLLFSARLFGDLSETPPQPRAGHERSEFLFPSSDLRPPAPGLRQSTIASHLPLQVSAEVPL